MALMSGACANLEPLARKIFYEEAMSAMSPDVADNKIQLPSEVVVQNNKKCPI